MLVDQLMDDFEEVKIGFIVFKDYLDLDEGNTQENIFNAIQTFRDFF